MTKTIIVMVLATLLACGKKDDKQGGDKKADGKTGIAECDELFAAADKFVACDKLDANMKDAYRNTYAKQKEEALSVKGDAKTRMAEGCKTSMSQLAEGAKFRGCAL